MYRSVAVSAFPLLCNPRHQPAPDLLPSPKTETLSLNTGSPEPPTQTPGNHFIFCLYDFNCFKYLISAKSHSIYPIVTGLFHSAESPQSSSVLYEPPPLSVQDGDSASLSRLSLSSNILSQTGRKPDWLFWMAEWCLITL